MLSPCNTYPRVTPRTLVLACPRLFEGGPEPRPDSLTERPRLNADFYINHGTRSPQLRGKTYLACIPDTHCPSVRSQQLESTLEALIMDKHKKQHEESSSNFESGTPNTSRDLGPVRQTESSMPLVSEVNPLSYNSTSQIIQWLSQVESDKENQRSPFTPSTTTSASQPPQNNSEPVTASAAPVQQATAVQASSPPTKQFVYKKVRRGAMLGLGGSGGWVPASYVWVRVPAATTGTVMPAKPGQLPSSSALQDDNEYTRTQDEIPLVAPPNSEADAQSTSNAGEPTCDVNDKPRP